MKKLTKRYVESIKSQDKDILVWDPELRGFLCKVTPKGNKSYFLYYRTKEGRQRKPKIGDHGTITCEQARGIAQKWLADVAQGKDPSLERQILRLNPTLRDLAHRYMEDHGSHKKASSCKEDQRLWNQYILPALGALRVSSTERGDILKLHQSLRHLSTTANRVLSLLSKALNLAELWGYRPDNSNPCRHVKKYAEQKRERFLNAEEIERLRSILDAEKAAGKELPSVLYAIELLLLTGCRLNEILTLRWKEVDIEKKCLQLSDSKTGKKTVYLSPAVLDILMVIPREAENEYVILGKKKEAHLINLQKPWRRIRKKAGLEDVRLHDLRHTFASVAAANGFSLPVIGALLGHKQTQTTARYAHLVGQPLLDATEKISNNINRKS
jgi:integrase